MAYQIEGTLFEVCTCNVLCPCWVGEDPDNGTCDGLLGWRVDKGLIDGVDVAGITLVMMAHIPGNILQGNWRVMAYLDQKATEDQEEALMNVFTGKLGGPIADMAKLVGEIVGVERVPIVAEAEGGKGRLKIGQAIEAEMEPFKGMTGESTTLHDTAFTTIPGSPAYLGKASRYTANVPALGLNIDLTGHNAVQGSFRFEG
ncbi:MAG TPA: DUF1326 domain-containing protein [Dehalococcoidia bacterium]|nr:DUF1326 domain-containing protein [Dehalococcoidia bacterium]